MAENWETRCLEEQARRDATIPKDWLLKELPSDDITNVMSVPYSCGIMTAKELEMTELDATELLGLLKSGEIKSFDLTLAFCKRAAIAQQLVRTPI
jgi:amidase